jgi:hypothetical protein
MINSYFIISRMIFESAIWRHDPHVLKLFIYLVGNARHSKTPKKYPHVTIQRGELVTSLEELVEENEFLEKGRLKKWSRQRAGRLLKKLSDEGYIDCIPDTYGTHIKVINYNTYQDPNAYKVDTSGMGVEPMGNDPGKGAETNKKVNNGNNEKNGEELIRFTKPSVEEVMSYMMNPTIKKNLSQEDAKLQADKFINYYESKGWMIGNSKMKDWQASVRNWVLNVKPDELVPDSQTIYQGQKYMHFCDDCYGSYSAPDGICPGCGKIGVKA